MDFFFSPSSSLMPNSHSDRREESALWKRIVFDSIGISSSPDASLRQLDGWGLDGAG